MRRSAAFLLAASGVPFACGSPRFTSYGGFEDAEIAAAIVTLDGAPLSSRSRLVFPQLELRDSVEIELGPDEELLIAAIDAAGLQSAVLGGAVVDPERVRLHPAGAQDCGLRGHELRINSDGSSQIRQALRRFSPTTFSLDVSTGLVGPPSEAARQSVHGLDLELPASVEACRDRWQIELVPFEREVVFGDGVDDGGTALAEVYYLRIVGVQSAPASRIFLASRHAIFGVRRDRKFDAAQDDFVKLDQIGLTAGPDQDWDFRRLWMAPGSAEGSFELLVWAQRTELSLDPSGYALVGLRFEAGAFAAPTIRWSSNDPTAIVAERDGDRGVFAANAFGNWVFVPFAHGPIESAQFDLGGIDALLLTSEPVAPHFAGVRGGRLGRGDLRRSETFELYTLRPDTHALQLRSATHGDEQWLYSSWKDGGLFRSRLAALQAIEPMGFGLPLRMARCAADEVDACGRSPPFGPPYGLEVLSGLGRSETTISVFEACDEIIIHEPATGCTTGIRYPTPPVQGAPALQLHADGDRVWASDESGGAELYEVSVKPRP